MGLHLLWMRNIRRAYCYESDCKEVVDFLTQGRLQLHEFASMSIDVHLCLARSWDIRLRHIPLEANVPADCLAGYEVAQQCDFMCFDVPQT